MTAARNNPRARAELAQRNLDVAKARFARDARPLRAAFERHRASWIVVGGLVGGFAAGALPLRFWSRLGALLGGSAGLVARSVLAPMIVGAFVARDGKPVDTTEPSG